MTSLAWEGRGRVSQAGAVLPDADGGRCNTRGAIGVVECRLGRGMGGTLLKGGGGAWDGQVFRLWGSGLLASPIVGGGEPCQRLSCGVK